MRSCRAIEEMGMANGGSLEKKYTNCHGADYCSGPPTCGPLPPQEMGASSRQRDLMHHHKTLTQQLLQI